MTRSSPAQQRLPSFGLTRLFSRAPICNRTDLLGVVVPVYVPRLTAIAGTWFGVTRSGRIGFLTNYTVPTAQIRRDAQGRGALVTDYLTSASTPLAYATDVSLDTGQYNGFNLVVGDFSGRQKDESSSMVYLGTQHDPIVSSVQPGVHCLSNRTLNDKTWPKVRVGCLIRLRLVELTPVSHRWVKAFSSICFLQTKGPRLRK